MHDVHNPTYVVIYTNKYMRVKINKNRSLHNIMKNNAYPKVMILVNGM